MSSLELIEVMISFIASWFWLRWFRASCGVAEKKIGTNPCITEPSNMSALSGKQPRRTETALSLLKYFFCMKVGGAGSPWTSSLRAFCGSAATAHRRLAPTCALSVALDEEGGLSCDEKNSTGTSWPSPSVTGALPCLLDCVE